MTAAVQENVHFDNIAADTDGFILSGGRYGVSVVGTSFGTVQLEMLGPDKSTWVSIYREFDKPDGTGGTEEDLIIGIFAANGLKVFDLPPGQYRLAVSSTTAVYADITSVPQA